MPLRHRPGSVRRLARNRSARRDRREIRSARRAARARRAPSPAAAESSSAEGRKNSYVHLLCDGVLGGDFIDELLQGGDVVPRGELEETFGGAFAPGEIGLQQSFDELRRGIGLHVAEDLAADLSVRPEAAADDDVIAIDRVAVGIDRDAGAAEPDVADVMLRAGMVTAGQMDVDRLIEPDAALAPFGDLFRMALGVGGRKFAAARAGAGDKAGTDAGGAPVEADRLDAMLRVLQAFLGDAGDQQILPDGQSHIAIAVVARD